MMTDNYGLNFGIVCRRPIDLQSRATSDFLDKLSDTAPWLDQIQEDTEKSTIEAFEQGKVRRHREVQITPNGLQAAAGTEISPEERREFLQIVATVAESLEIAKRDVSVVDFRAVLRIKHWGNHHDLTARALWEPGSLYKTVQELGRPLIDVTVKVQTWAPGRDDIAIAFTCTPRTAAKEIRSGEYDGDEIVVLCGIARTYGFHRAGSFSDMLAELEQVWTETVVGPISNGVVAPLKRLAVAEKPEQKK